MKGNSQLDDMYLKVESDWAFIMKWNGFIWLTVTEMCQPKRKEKSFIIRFVMTSGYIQDIKLHTKELSNSLWKLFVNHWSLKFPSGIQLKSNWCSLCKYLPEYSLDECRADGCNRFSISRSLVVRFLVWRNRNSVQTIATTATHSVDL